MRGLVTNTNYYFIIKSNSKTYKNKNKTIYKIKTTPITNTPKNNIINKKIIITNNQPIPKTIIYIKIKKKILKSTQTKNSKI